MYLASMRTSLILRLCASTDSHALLFSPLHGKPLGQALLMAVAYLFTEPVEPPQGGRLFLAMRTPMPVFPRIKPCIASARMLV